MADWSDLLEDLLIEIAKRIQLVEDFVAFGGVCTSWRAAANKDNFDNSRLQIPLLMLAEKKDSDDREFFSLSRSKIWRTLSLPETRGKKCMESKGWFITLGESGEMNLLNPFSRVQFELPNITSFPEYEIYETSTPFFFLHRAVLSVSPSQTSDFVLMVVHSGGLFLGFWKPGYNSWIRIESLAFHTGSFCDVIYYHGKFYAITYEGKIWVCDISGPNPTFAHAFTIEDREFLKVLRQGYLVESSKDLLVVARDGNEHYEYNDSYGVKNFLVYRLDLIRREFKAITTLGDMAIFVGHNSTITVDATSFSGIIKPNCIYFTDDSIEAYTCTTQGGGKDMGIYHLEDKRIERFEDFQSFSLIGPPVWITPSL